MICTNSTQAQSLLKFNEIIVVNTKVNDVAVQIEVADQAQFVSSRIEQSDVNEKEGFKAIVDADSSVLTLYFSRQFSKNELQALLKYSGIQLEGSAFNQLYKLLN